MNNILILQATARKEGTVATLAKTFANVAAENNGIKIETVDVTKLKFNPCIGCMKCRSAKQCIYKGDEADIVGQKIEEADAIVVASPVYWGNMPGILKSIFDRNVFRMMGEKAFGIPKPLLTGKKGIIITACTTPFPFNVVCGQTSGLVHSVNEIFKSSGIKTIKVIAAPGTKDQKKISSKLNKSAARLAGKIVRSLALIVLLTMTGKPLFAAENILDFSAVTDFAYYPESDYIKGGTHFAPITSPYKSTEIRTTLHAAYTIPIPFNDSMLFSGNTISIDAGLAISPISVMPKLTLSVTPIACFNIKLGANLATAWELMGIKSLSYYDPAKVEYVEMDAFKTWFYQFWMYSALMFDTAVLFPGDWHHVVMLASLELNYAGLINAPSNCNLFQWQTTPGMVNSLQYVNSYLLGYQMPLAVSLVGCQLELSGYFNDKGFNDEYAKYNGEFMSVSISPLAEINITDNDKIFLMASFSTRRSFKESHTEIEEEPLLTQSGSEWFFNRFSCSWTHKF